MGCNKPTREPIAAIEALLEARATFTAISCLAMAANYVAHHQGQRIVAALAKIGDKQ
jgi:hypothetical protein